MDHWSKLLEVDVLASTNEERITTLVKDAKDMLDSGTDKKQVIIQLAKAFEGLIPMDTICMEITNRLQYHLKSRTIREYLDEKYKKQSRIKNAKKQRDNRFKSLSEAPPENQTVESSGKGQDVDTQSVKKDMMDNDLISLFPQKRSKLPPPQQHLSPEYEEKDSKETIKALREKVSECQEIIEKFDHFAAADSIVESKKYFSVTEILEYIRFNGIRTLDEKISIGVQFDKNNGRILFFGLVK